MQTQLSCKNHNRATGPSKRNSKTKDKYKPIPAACLGETSAPPQSLSVAAPNQAAQLPMGRHGPAICQQREVRSVAPATGK